jgi:hypothetical protein
VTSVRLLTRHSADVALAPQMRERCIIAMHFALVMSTIHHGSNERLNAFGINQDERQKIKKLVLTSERTDRKFSLVRRYLSHSLSLFCFTFTFASLHFILFTERQPNTFSFDISSIKANRS